MNARFVTILAGSVLALNSLGVSAEALPDDAKLYKSPNCGCCDDYADHLRSKGIDVEVIDTEDMNRIKKDAGLPYGEGACHTTVMGDYVIEGHVPFVAIEKLFDETPDVDGISLAGMPIGTPGMPGPQEEPYEVKRFKDREASAFMTL